MRGDFRLTPRVAQGPQIQRAEPKTEQFGQGAETFSATALRYYLARRSAGSRGAPSSASVGGVRGGKASF